LLASAGPGAAQAPYPDKPIRLLLPFPAGGAVDIIARVTTAKMSDELGKPFIIENKSGAGGVIATDAVAKAAPAHCPKCNAETHGGKFCGDCGTKLVG